MFRDLEHIKGVYSMDEEFYFTQIGQWLIFYAQNSHEDIIRRKFIQQLCPNHGFKTVLCIEYQPLGSICVK
jgi:hypothetical protein